MERICRFTRKITEPAVIGGDFAVRKVTGGFMLEPPGRVMDNRWNGPVPAFRGTGIFKGFGPAGDS